MINKSQPVPYFQNDLITLYCGDSNEIAIDLTLQGLHFDCVITDPPYNPGKDYGAYKDNLSVEEYQQKMSDIVQTCSHLAANQFWLPYRRDWRFWSRLLPEAEMIIIRRGTAGLQRNGWRDQYQIAFAVGKPNPVEKDLWEDIRLVGEGFFFTENTWGHPGYTPSKIFARACKLFAKESIFDPYAGTGTSLIEAAKMGIKATGIEIDKRWCDLIVERITKGQNRLF